MRDKLTSGTTIKIGTFITGWQTKDGTVRKNGTVIGRQGPNVLVSADNEEDLFAPLSFVGKGVQFFVPETMEERDWSKYTPRIIETLRGLYHRFSIYEIGVHEPDNSWVGLDPLKLYERAEKADVDIIGHCMDAPFESKQYGLQSAAIVAERKDTFEKIWCHIHRHYLEEMLEDFEYLIAR